MFQKMLAKKLWNCASCFCSSCLVADCIFLPGPMGRSPKTSRRTWVWGPPTTPSPQTRWWTPSGVTEALATVAPQCLRWAQMLKDYLKGARSETYGPLPSNRKPDIFSCLTTTAITCWWRLLWPTRWWREGPRRGESEYDFWHCRRDSDLLVFNDRITELTNAFLARVCVCGSRLFIV